MTERGRKPWDRLDGEPDIWYDRFEIFRQLGAVRTLPRAYAIAKEENPELLKGPSPSASWRENCAKWNWIERTRAFDEAQRERFRAEEHEISLDRRLRRLEMIRELEQDAFQALQTANIGDMNETTARAYLPQLRMLIVALLGIERVELGGPVDESGDQQSSAVQDEIMQQLAKSFGKKVAVGGDTDLTS